jgi:hypothetical protein
MLLHKIFSGRFGREAHAGKNSLGLALMAAEEVVLIAAGAVCALQAADEEDGNADSD